MLKNKFCKDLQRRILGSRYYILVQSLRLTGLFTSQDNTKDYGTFTGVIKVLYTHLQD